MQGGVLAVTDEAALPISVVSTAVSELGIRGVEQCDPRIITQASSLSTFLPPFPVVVLIIYINRFAIFYCVHVFPN